MSFATSKRLSGFTSCSSRNEGWSVHQPVMLFVGAHSLFPALQKVADGLAISREVDALAHHQIAFLCRPGPHFDTAIADCAEADAHLQQ